MRFIFQVKFIYAFLFVYQIKKWTTFRSSPLKHINYIMISWKTVSVSVSYSCTFLILPLVISLLSVSPPHKEMATWGRSPVWSNKLSTPLSIPLLPTDCGDWSALLTPIIIVSESPLVELLPPSLRAEGHTQSQRGFSKNTVLVLFNDVWPKLSCLKLR